LARKYVLYKPQDAAADEDEEDKDHGEGAEDFVLPEVGFGNGVRLFPNTKASETPATTPAMKQDRRKGACKLRGRQLLVLWGGRNNPHNMSRPLATTQLLPRPMNRSNKKRHSDRRSIANAYGREASGTI